MGADRFAEQAAAELRATGERARTLETAVNLTPQETRVADLAVAGAYAFPLGVPVSPATGTWFPALLPLVWAH